MKHSTALLLTLSLTASLASAQTQIHKFVASDAGFAEAFGHAVAMEGNLAVVGARDARVGGVDMGAAYIYDVTTGQELFKLTPVDGASGDKFGFSVAIQNGIVVIGSPHHDVMGMNMVGSAYVFDATTGLEIGRLVPVSKYMMGHFGVGVALDNGKAAVGAFNTNQLGSDSGSAYIFDLTTYAQDYELLASDGTTDDQLGWWVAIDGNQVLVGADKNDDLGADSGSAYLFDVTTGLETAKLLASDGAAGDRFGWTVDMENGVAVISGHRHDGVGGTDSGAVYVFDTTTGMEIAKYEVPDGAPFDEFSYSLDLDGSRIVTGSPYDDDAGANSGSCYVLDSLTGVQEFKITPADGASSDLFGNSVELRGDLLVVGSVFDDDGMLNAGSAYLYDLAPPCATKYCTVAGGSVNNTANLDASGCSLAGPITLDMSNGPANQFCYLLIGAGTSVVTDPAGALGDLCVVGGFLSRYRLDLGAISTSGTFSVDISNSNSGGPGFGIPSSGGASIQAGETWNFQYWHRNPSGQPSGFTEAVSVTFN